MNTKTLIIDNNVDPGALGNGGLCYDFRRYIEGRIHVRRLIDGDSVSDPRDYSHIILTGSRTSILDTAPWIEKLMGFIRVTADAGVPLLGVCYGHQIIARAYGGEKCVRRSQTPEFGWVEIRQKQGAQNPMLKGLPREFYSFQSHFEEVSRLPDPLILSAESDRCAVQAFQMRSKPVFGVQFHPERNAIEGQASLEKRKKTVPKDCIFNDGKAESLFTENVARTIFRNFFAQQRLGS